MEFFATSDGQAVLANVAGESRWAARPPAAGRGEVELAAYDPEEDLILEDNRGFVQKAGREEIGVLLAKPWGRSTRPRRSNAGVRRGDIWIQPSMSSGATPTATTFCSAIVRVCPYAERRGFPAPVTDAIGAFPRSIWR